MNIFIPLLLAGIERGSAYALVAVGFTVIYASTQIINFAQGEFLMVGAMVMFAVTAWFGAPVWLALLAALLGGALIGWILERGFVQPLENRGASDISLIIATLAFGITVSQATGLGISRNPEVVPDLVGGSSISLGIARVSPQALLAMGMTAVIAVAIWYFFRHTTMGLAIRAVGYNREGAQVLGLNIPVMVTLTFAVSGVLAALAGVIVGAAAGASAYMGLTYGVKGFAGAVLGGLGNPVSAVLGGILIGVVESFGQFYLPQGYGATLPFVLLIIVLMIRPRGLFPEAVVR